MNKEQLSTMRKQCDTAEENAKSLNIKVAELISQLDACRSQCTQMNQEKEMLQKGLDATRLEKNALDKNRVELNSMVRLEALCSKYSAPTVRIVNEMTITRDCISGGSS